MQLQFFIFPTMVLFFSLPVFGLPADTEMNTKRQLLTDTRPAPPPMANPPPIDFVKRQIHTDPKPAPPSMANTPSSDLSGPARASSHSVSVELCRHERFQECSVIEMTHGKCYGPMDLRNHAVGRNE
ncbi:Protein of unknown function [Pyronema omphalodes CBS 100304]|uniref:Uncharacterized protein n=1 Tax=Pyronema omphalodes (strain CBS 100304) TaxID=1076935 RepID=U4LTG7_PYROM|nr:Protein of unknown function [Pyronema omphalodes CBS 100304]